MAKYIFRVDDVYPKMDWDKFESLAEIFDKFNVRPLLAIIPDNKNELLDRGTEREDFWQAMRGFQNKNWDIAMHGYQHKAINRKKGLLTFGGRSEFTGFPYNEQFKKIQKGQSILESKGLKSEIFVAPNHSFDKITLDALRDSGFNYISDGIALWPFKKRGIVWIPQITWRIRRFPFGIITFCLHPDSFSEKDFIKIENFIDRYRKNIIDLNWIVEWLRRQNKVKIFFLSLFNSFFQKIWYLVFKFTKYD